MRITYSSIPIILFFCAFGCKDNSKTNASKNQETPLISRNFDLLDYNGTPSEVNDRSMLMYSDQGAWFGFSFPNVDSSFGGFSGPFLMTQQNGVWSSQVLSKLEIKLSDKNIQWKHHKTRSYNSHLEQTFSSKSVDLQQQLVYSSGHTALIKSIITNKSDETIDLSILWKNDPILADQLQITSNKNIVTIKSSKSDAKGQLIFPEKSILKSTDSNYSSLPEKIQLKPNETKEITISQTFIFPEYSWEKEQEELNEISFDAVLRIR